MTSKKYSTTRMLTTEAPTINNISDAKFESFLFLPAHDKRIAEGGLRTKGLFKSSLDDKPLITVVTVVYNGEEFLEETILSVINQTYENVEYIIIDGGSTDGTLDIIKKYDAQIDYWVSEPDGGIYDAMNKGITLATGEWINFMNAGDSFYTDKVLREIFESEISLEVDIFYGNYNVIYPAKKRIRKAGNHANMWKGSQICHQSSFIRCSLHKQNLFDTKTGIVADFRFFYESYQQGACFKYIDVVISNYAAGGISDIKRIDVIVGFWNVVGKNTKVNMHYIYAILKTMVKDRIKKMIGLKLK